MLSLAQITNSSSALDKSLEAGLYLLLLILSIAFGYLCYRLGKSIDLNRWVLGISGFISMWIFLIGFRVQGTASIALFSLGSVGFLAILIWYGFRRFATFTKPVQNDIKIDPLTGSYYSVAYSSHSPFAPSREEFISGSMICANCNVVVPSDYIACWNCGTFMSETYFTWKLCHICGKKLPEYADICDSCGSSFDNLSAWK